MKSNLELTVEEQINTNEKIKTLEDTIERVKQMRADDSEYGSSDGQEDESGSEREDNESQSAAGSEH